MGFDIGWQKHPLVDITHLSTLQQQQNARRYKKVKEGGLSGDNETGPYYSMLLAPQVPLAVFS
jgi:hypothetical protein